MECIKCSGCKAHYQTLNEAESCCSKELFTDINKKIRWNGNQKCKICKEIIVVDTSRKKTYIPYGLRGIL